MEEITMERLLTDMTGVINQINELVEKKDIEGAKKALSEIEGLVANANGVVLDNLEDRDSDHVLHHLLRNISGIIERETVTPGRVEIIGLRYYTNEEVRAMIEEAEAEVRRLSDVMRETEGFNDEAYSIARSQRTELIARIAELKAALVEGQEFSTLTYTDEHLLELQQERARLVEEKERLLQEKEANLREIERLRAEERTGTPGSVEIETRIKEIDLRITELEALFVRIEGQITEIRGISVRQLISDLRTREEINEDDIAFLESLLPEIEQRENVLPPNDYTYMGRLSDEQIIRRLLSEELHLSQEEIDATIGDYELVQATPGAHDENGEDNPISERQLVRKTKVKGDITIGEALDLLEAQLHDGPVVDHSEEIAEIDARIAELDQIIANAQAKITEIEGQQISDIILSNQRTSRNSELEARRAELQEKLRLAGERVRETRGFDEQNAQARADYSEIVRQIAEINAEINRTSPENIAARRAELQEQLKKAGDRVKETRGFDEQNAQARADYSEIVRQLAELDALEAQNNGLSQDDIEFLETLLPETVVREALLPPNDYTYMGRLSDEQIIRRLLSEELHLSQEEIDATIGDYELVQATPGAHDENGEDFPLSERQLVRKTKVKNSVTVKEALDKLETDITGLEARRAELQEQLKRAGDRVKETRGFDEQNAQARADYSEIVRQLSEVDAQITTLKERQSRFKAIVGISEQEQIIAKAQEEKATLVAKREELVKDSSRGENPEVRAKIDRLKQISGMTSLEVLLLQYREEHLRLIEERKKITITPGTPGIDNSEKIAALEARNKEIDARIAEIDARIAEIDIEIGQIPGVVVTPPSSETERLDLGAEAARIGDHIFKTALIRRELAERNISRDEFLAFYQQGLNQTNQQIEQLAVEKEKMEAEMKIILIDPNTGERFDKLIIQAGNSPEAIKYWEQTRKNFIAAGREEQLKEVGLDHEITSQEDVERMSQFFLAYKESVNEGISQIKASIHELKENAMIFATEIARINAEKATLEVAGGSLEELKTKAEERKALRKKLLKASITPEKELTDEQRALLEKWQETSERFLSKKTTTKYTYIDKDGVEKVIEVDSIDDTYPEYKSDIGFLGVPAYKENLEQVSAWEQTEDPYVFGPEVGKAYEAAEKQQEGAGRAIIERIIADKQKYVETFNGIPNPHKVKYENWKTAGSTLKGMKPVSRDLPAPTRVGNAVSNVFRFLGLRAPKFTRIDEHGKEVSAIGSGVGTLLMDGVVLTCVGVSAAFGYLPLVGLGYAAKGIVTVGNKIAARIEYARHGEEIDGNKPVIHQADSNAREVARKDYYKKHGDNRFVAWFKAKNDKYFRRDRAAETEEAIVEERYAKYAAEEDERTEKLAENVRIANKNQEARQANQTKMAMGENAYNQIVSDPDSVDMDVATAALARNAVLESRKPGTGRESVNPNSTVESKKQYVKPQETLDQTEILDEKALDSVEGPVSAITMEQIYTGRKQHVDRLNLVLKIVTAMGMKFGFTAWKNGFLKEEVIHHDAVTEDKVIHHDAEYGEVEVTDYETQYDTDVTLEELAQHNAGKNMNGYTTVSGGESGPVSQPIDGDTEFTAGWQDNGTEWGTGISDAEGLTAPEFTDRLADAGLLQPDGVLRQDITVGELLDALGRENLSDLSGVYLSAGDDSWVNLGELMQGLTRQVPVGSHMETQLLRDAWDETITEIIKPAWDETVRTFSPGLMIRTLKDGAVVGLGTAAVDALHEAAQTTYIDGATPGRPEETTPEARDTFDVIADKLSKEAKAIIAERERRLREEEEEQIV